MADIELTDAEVVFYRESGYIVVPDVVSADEVARLRAAIDALGAGAGAGTPAAAAGAASGLDLREPARPGRQCPDSGRGTNEG